MEHANHAKPLALRSSFLQSGVLRRNAYDANSYGLLPGNSVSLELIFLLSMTETLASLYCPSFSASIEAKRLALYLERNNFMKPNNLFHVCSFNKHNAVPIERRGGPKTYEQGTHPKKTILANMLASTTVTGYAHNAKTHASAGN